MSARQANECRNTQTSPDAATPGNSRRPKWYGVKLHAWIICQCNKTRRTKRNEKFETLLKQPPGWRWEVDWWVVGHLAGWMPNKLVSDWGGVCEYEKWNEVSREEDGDVDEDEETSSFVSSCGLCALLLFFLVFLFIPELKSFLHPWDSVKIKHSWDSFLVFCLILRNVLALTCQTFSTHTKICG